MVVDGGRADGLKRCVGSGKCRQELSLHPISLALSVLLLHVFRSLNTRGESYTTAAISSMHFFQFLFSLHLALLG